MLKALQVILLAQLFYSFMITGTAYYVTLPDEIATEFSTNMISTGNVTERLDEAVQRQVSIPLIDVGALVFYSGNVVLDLLLNFVTAIPSAFSLLINSFFLIVNVDAWLAAQTKIIIYTVTSAMYIISLIAFLINVRSGVVGAV